MQFLIKPFAEIAIKSKPVRHDFMNRLERNVVRVMERRKYHFRRQRYWDRIVVQCEHLSPQQQYHCAQVLARISGISKVIEVVEFPLGDLAGLVDSVTELLDDSIAGKTFAIRCKRSGNHAFTSVDVARRLGDGIRARYPSCKVDLSNPQSIVALEIWNEKVFFNLRSHDGLGGFPLGGIGKVLCLMSGGYDSTLASYNALQRGLVPHFCFFDLGGSEHELLVRKIALRLWSFYGSSHRLRFLCVPFTEVLEEILCHTKASFQNVLVKRMMLRAAAMIAPQLGCHALVTGDSVSQVSSQTLINLEVTDQACDMTILRPLIFTNKGDIVTKVRELKLERLVNSVPEYCAITGSKPATRLSLAKVHGEEQRIDFVALYRAIEQTKLSDVAPLQRKPTLSLKDRLTLPGKDNVIVDIRHPVDQEKQPLTSATTEGVAVLSIPFYRLTSEVSQLKSDINYWFYCSQGVLSRLHASRFQRKGFSNIHAVTDSN